MKIRFAWRQSLKLGIATALVMAGFSGAESALGAPPAIFTNRLSFNSAVPPQILVQTFETFANGSAADGALFFVSPFVGITVDPATIFAGSWNGGPGGLAGQFSGNGIIPEPRHQGKPLVLNFSPPVFAIGGNAFDDFDGSPSVNVIKLTATMSDNSTQTVSETSSQVGDTGFLGIVADNPANGIVKAEFSITGGNGSNLEVDLLTVVPLPLICDGQAATILGTAGDDILTGTPGADVILGLDGQDIIYGLGGNDVICGGSGDDVIYAGLGNDRLFGNAGHDVLHGDAGNDTLVGGNENDILLGEVGNDLISGGNGNDSIDGGAGTDNLKGENGNDTIYGGTHNDTLSGGANKDVCDGGPHTVFPGDTATTCEVVVNVP